MASPLLIKTLNPSLTLIAHLFLHIIIIFLNGLISSHVMSVSVRKREREEE